MTLRLLMGRRWRIAWAVLNCVPLPGLGAIVVGHRNPHTRLMRRGVGQMALVLLGSWPLVLPGVAGFGWAVWDALQIAKADELPAPI